MFDIESRLNGFTVTYDETTQNSRGFCTVERNLIPQTFTLLQNWNYRRL